MAIEEHRILVIDGDETIAMLHRADPPSRCGVVIVVGGPQYRVGSHRQFVQLAREISGAGFDVLRFDVRGMGDGSGEARTFDELDSDIRHAVDELCRASPNLTEIVLLGLCDGASAALMYAPGDPRIRGLVLMNPWTRNESGAARVRLRSYYLKRLLSRDFWQKFMAGRVAVGWTVKEVSGATRSALAGSSTSNFLIRMEGAARAFTGKVLFLLSGVDYTADEFREWISASPPRKALLQRNGVELITIDEANHTFSTTACHGKVSRQIVRFMELGAGQKPKSSP